MREALLSHLHPSFRARSFDLAARVSVAGLPIQRYEGWRDPSRQADLFAFGRASGVGVPGRHKTFEPAWCSNHQWGFAEDWVWWLAAEGRWSWDPPAGHAWEEFHELARAAGLERLNFEEPHVQLPGFSARRALAGDHALLAHGDADWEENLEAAAARWGFREVKDRYGLTHPGAPVLDARPAGPVPAGMVYDEERGLCLPNKMADLTNAQLEQVIETGKLPGD